MVVVRPGLRAGKRHPRPAVALPGQLRARPAVGLRSGPGGALAAAARWLSAARRGAAAGIPRRRLRGVNVPDYPNSEALFARARKVTPGGVNSPVRAFGAVGGVPRFMVRGSGPYLTDVDGREYVDLVCSWGPMILGHAHPSVVGAVAAALADGTSFGAVTPGEVDLAEEIVARAPVEQVRLVNSGTEATMSAGRLARGFTGRPLGGAFA